MKKIIIFICVVTILITINSCTKPRAFYATCDTGHPHWEGTHYTTESVDSQLHAEMDAHQHDTNVHGGVTTASVIEK